MSSRRFFATASRGTEAVLAGELRDLGLAPAAPVHGGVAFGTALEHGYRACVHSRIASRVLMPLATFEAIDADALYDGVHAIDWTDHLGPERTFAVAVAGKGSPAGPPHYLALKAKDAVVDRIRDRIGRRPDVDPRRPDVRIHLHVGAREVSVAIDLAGRGLHRRGGRRAGAAPLRETLAAAVLRIAGWPDAEPGTPLFDPMCGSGTLLLEAAGIALDIAPGLGRRSSGPRGWRGHDAALWERVIAEARGRAEAARRRPVRIAGADASPAAVADARENLAAAGLVGCVAVRSTALRDAAPPWPEPGLVVTNPPYGARLGEAGELGPLYETLGDTLRRRFLGWRAFVLTGNPALARRIGLRPASRRPLYNGPIDCRLLEFPIAATAPDRDGGPAWRRASDEAAPFARRLAKNVRERDRWARRERLTCYRVYDSDIPEWNVAVDRYGEAVRVEEYAPPSGVDPAAAERRLRDVLRVVPEVLGVAPEAVVLRVRRRLGPGEQPSPVAATERFLEVEEDGLVFRVNLEDRLDTGLFLDDREIRRRIRDHASGAAVLNLFAHTCTATVAAAAGGAVRTLSVDLSRRYLDWGRRNLARNGFTGPAHRLVRADVLRFLEREPGGDRFDLVYVGAPSRSRSRGMRGEFDVQRDHVALIRAAAFRAARGGTILFTTNLRTFRLDEASLGRFRAREITAEITPPDFERRPRLRAWSIVRA